MRFPRFGYQIRLRTTGTTKQEGRTLRKKVCSPHWNQVSRVFYSCGCRGKKLSVTQYDNICILICVVNNPRPKYAKTHEWKVECFLCIRMLTLAAVCNLLRIFKRFCNVNILPWTILIDIGNEMRANEIAISS